MKKFFGAIMLAVLVFGGCNLFKGNEKQNFIDATIEASCLVFQAEDPFAAELESEAKAIYEKYGFDVESDEAIQAVADKYSEDPDVQSAILAGIQTCSPELFEEVEEEAPIEAETAPVEIPAE